MLTLITKVLSITVLLLNVRYSYKEVNGTEFGTDYEDQCFQKPRNQTRPDEIIQVKKLFPRQPNTAGITTADGIFISNLKMRKLSRENEN